MAVELVPLDRASMTYEYGVDVQRLVPWAALNAPFEGAWAVVRAGTDSTPHSHHECEIFIAVRGAAVVECDGQQSPFRVGDVALFQPGQQHRVLNDSDQDFEFYSIWWDREMSERFLARADAGITAGTARTDAGVTA
jgi:mannose-6-phosphate isomerase-like protein (cupin superfamily)